MPPGGKTYQVDFATFSSTEVKLRDLEVCFIASSTLYDWRRIQKDMFVNISLVIQKYAFFRSKQDTSYTQSCRWGQDVPSWVCEIFRTVIKLRGLDVCFIPTYNLYNWRRIEEDMFVDICLVIFTKTCIFVGTDRALHTRSFATKKFVSSQRQNYMIGVGFK